ncbi:MAG TPA: HEPN domain-containing protein [Candidatus Binatia bacterium]|nr:HEPN domain-containing protein [Candidatus Binatia bacterium]
MKESTKKFLEKAFRSVQAAERLTKVADAEFGVGRAYYAMFYAAQALLNERGLRFRKHAGVHSAFAEQFVKTGLIDKRYHRWLLAGFSKRITADYGIEAELTLEDATLLIGQAREFLAAAKTFLEKKV